MPITPSTRRRYEKLLKQAREQSMLVVAAAATGGPAHGHARGAGDVPEDCALIEAEIDAILATQESDTLAAIDRALQVLRTEPDVFGRCDECGAEIGTEWLDVAPWLSRCAQHADGAIF